MHSGAQDSKSALDGHFAKGMQHVKRFFNSGHDAITPIGLMKALRSNGGTPNSVAELVAIHRNAIDNLCNDYSDEIANIKKVGNHFETKYNDAARTLTA